MERSSGCLVCSSVARPEEGDCGHALEPCPTVHTALRSTLSPLVSQLLLHHSKWEISAQCPPVPTSTPSPQMRTSSLRMASSVSHLIGGKCCPNLEPSPPVPFTVGRLVLRLRCWTPPKSRRRRNEQPQPDPFATFRDVFNRRPAGSSSSSAEVAADDATATVAPGESVITTAAPDSSLTEMCVPFADSRLGSTLRIPISRSRKTRVAERRVELEREIKATARAV